MWQALLGAGATQAAMAVFKAKTDTSKKKSHTFFIELIVSLQDLIASFKSNTELTLKTNQQDRMGFSEFQRFPLGTTHKHPRQYHHASAKTANASHRAHSLRQACRANE